MTVFNQLSDRTVKSAKPGEHCDGQGLWLHVAESGARKWVLRFSFGHRVHEMGLGSAHDVPLAEARSSAREARRLAASGIDPVAARREGRKLVPPKPTFGECAGLLIESKRSGWRSEKHAAQWHQTLKTHCQAISSLPVDEVGVEAVLSVLRPVWNSVPVTAARLRARIEAVLGYATAHGWRAGDNPASWPNRLEFILPGRPRVEQKHLAAMDYKDVPDFLARLRSRASLEDACLASPGRAAPRRASPGLAVPGPASLTHNAAQSGGPSTAALALEFLILCASRSGEVLGARWSEIDLEGKVWTVPAARMKAGREHRVPLSGRAAEILEGLSGTRHGPFVFVGRRGKRLVDGSFRTLVPRGTTAHGFRSSFRVWCSEVAHAPREIAESCLGHVTGSAVEQAYARSDLLERRRVIMEAWATFCAGAQAANVHQLRA